MQGMSTSSPLKRLVKIVASKTLLINFTASRLPLQSRDWLILRKMIIGMPPISNRITCGSIPDGSSEFKKFCYIIYRFMGFHDSVNKLECDCLSLNA